MTVIEERISRGRLLKRAGAGAVVLGAGSTMTASAYASGGGGQPDPCTANSLAGQTACAVCAGQTSCGDGCSCIVTKNGCCFCHQISFCSDLKACQGQNDCPAGWKCAYSCCSGTLCIPPCGVVINSVAAAGGPTTAG